MVEKTVRVRVLMPVREALLYFRYRFCRRVMALVLLGLTGFLLDSASRDICLTVGIILYWLLSERGDIVLRRALTTEKLAEVAFDEVVRDERLPAPGAADASLPATRLYN